MRDGMIGRGIWGPMRGHISKGFESRERLETGGFGLCAMGLCVMRRAAGLVGVLKGLGYRHWGYTIAFCILRFLIPEASR